MHEGKDINPVAREPLSAELVRYSDGLAARAENLAEYVHMRLLPVMNSEPPSPPSERLATCGIGPHYSMSYGPISM